MSKRVLVLCQRKGGIEKSVAKEVHEIKSFIKRLFLGKKNIKIEFMTKMETKNVSDEMDYDMFFGDSSSDFKNFLTKNKKKYDAIVLGCCPSNEEYFKTMKFIMDLHILLKDKNSFIAYFPNTLVLKSEHSRRSRALFNEFIDRYFTKFDQKIEGIWTNTCRLPEREIRKYEREALDLIDLTVDTIDLTVDDPVPHFKKTKKSLKKSLKKSSRKATNLKA